MERVRAGAEARRRPRASECGRPPRAGRSHSGPDVRRPRASRGRPGPRASAKPRALPPCHPGRFARSRRSRRCRADRRGVRRPARRRRRSILPAACWATGVASRPTASATPGPRSTWPAGRRSSGSRSRAAGPRPRCCSTPTATSCRPSPAASPTPWQRPRTAPRRPRWNRSAGPALTRSRNSPRTRTIQAPRPPPPARGRRSCT
jgi:hypothetical protein